MREVPLYEVLLYFAPSLAARLNAQQGKAYDVDKLLADSLNGSSIPRGGWGSITGQWGDYTVNGLIEVPQTAAGMPSP